MQALKHLQEVKEEGKIRHVGLTNFDTKHLQVVTDGGIAIASNQVCDGSFFFFLHARILTCEHIVMVFLIVRILVWSNVS